MPLRSVVYIYIYIYICRCARLLAVRRQENLVCFDDKGGILGLDQNTSIQPLHHEADQKRHEREGGYKVTVSSELHAQEDSPSPTVTRQRRYARYHLSQRRLTPQESQYSSAARTRKERTLVWIEILCGRGEGWILLKIPRCDIDGVREACVGWSQRERRWLVSK